MTAHYHHQWNKIQVLKLLCRPQCEMDKFTRTNAYKHVPNTMWTPFSSAFCNWTSTHKHTHWVQIHNCQMELDLILPLMMKIGSVTWTHHCHFTSFYTVYLCVRVWLHWTSSSVNCITHATASYFNLGHCERCGNERQKQIYKYVTLCLNSFSALSLIRYHFCCYCILCFVNVSSVLALICGLPCHLIRPSHKKTINVFY